MFKFNTIEEALEDLRQGKIVLVTDDETRENEGDFICWQRICHHRQCQLYGHPRQGADLYAHEH